MDQIQQNSFIPKYFQLKKMIIEGIDKGTYPVHSQLPSTSEIMKRHSVSTTTVKRIINELVREGRTYTIQGKGWFVSSGEASAPLPAALAAGQQSKRVVFVIPGGDSEYIGILIKGMLKVLKKAGYNLEICYTEDNYNQETRLLSKFLEEPIAGLIISPAWHNLKYNAIFKLRRKNIPVVLYARNLKENVTDFVGSNNILGAKEAVEYLIDSGHRRIVFFGGLEGSHEFDRLEGYRNAFAARGLAVDKKLILEIKTEDRRMPEEEVSAKYLDFLRKKKIDYSAIFCTYDLLAIAVCKALKKMGKTVPGDVSVIGFGDYLEMSKYAEVPLTTVRQDLYRQSYCAAKIMVKRIAEVRGGGSSCNDSFEKLLVKTKLIIRDSVKKL